jgi:cytochrome c peroxidase
MKTFTSFAVLFCALSIQAADPGAARTPAELRKSALEVVAPLPTRMPGAEKDTPELVALGKKLFNDKRLSINQSQSCNTCHRVDEQRGGVDNEQFSLGAFGKRGGRNAPTVLNAGLHVTQFWDGRAATLEDQAKGPVLNPVEMAMPNPVAVIQRLQTSKDYPPLFAKAFPGGTASSITYDNVARAIAAFERTLLTHDRFDDFLRGNDRALNQTELGGLNLFLTTGCTTCHNGPLLGGNAYHKVGLINPYPNTKDVGRMEVTKDADDKFKFKVPSLRNIALTAPYFHDGGAASLAGAAKQMAHLQLGKELTDAEVNLLVAFLQSLTDKPRARTAAAK